MLYRTTHLELSRRVVVYYLLFFLCGVTFFLIALVSTNQSILRSRFEVSGLSQLPRRVAAAEIEFLRHGKDNLPSLVGSFRNEAALTYCAIVSTENQFLAHTSEDLDDAVASDTRGDPIQWGDYRGVRYHDEKSGFIREYWAPLNKHGKQFGTMRLGISEPDMWSTVLTTTKFAPVYLFAPLGLVVGGAMLLRRTVAPIADVDAQLRRAAVASDVTELAFKPVRITGGGAVGWNRLVKYYQECNDAIRLDERLEAILASRGQQHSDDVLNSLGDGIAVTESEATITYANRAMAGLLKKDKLVGRSVLDLLISGESEDDIDLLTDPSTTGRAVVVEISHNYQGTERCLRVARQPILSSGKASRDTHVWSVRDVTQQKLADKMREQFLDSATHELRTPLANIKAYAESLALNETLDVEKQKEFCNIINSEATRLARFIDELLSISSIESGSLRIERQNTAIDRLFHEVVDKVQPLMDQKDIQFSLVLPEKMPECRLDKDKLSAAVINLLGNAAKYTPDGGHVTMKVKVTEQSLLIDVEDTGFGISEEEVSKVFDKFFRSSDPRVSEQNGSGLGLSLSYEVVRAHGGTLTAQSELNKGSTFSIAIPKR